MTTAMCEFAPVNETKYVSGDDMCESLLGVWTPLRCSNQTTDKTETTRVCDQSHLYSDGFVWEMRSTKNRRRNYTKINRSDQHRSARFEKRSKGLRDWEELILEDHPHGSWRFEWNIQSDHRVEYILRCVCLCSYSMFEDCLSIFHRLFNFV